MPRVNLGSPPQKLAAKSPALKRMEDAVVERYGLCLDLKTTMKVIGLKDPKQARAWLQQEGIPAIDFSEHKKRYWAPDVVQALYNAQFRS